MTDFRVRPLDGTTWPDFAELIERHNGVWGGCWCLNFHEEGAARVHSPEQRRDLKEERVREGLAHAALVYDGARCVGWCQYGSPLELPRIKHQQAYQGALHHVPDWRITCFFVGRTHRHVGVADTALAGALEEIARLGGGLVESYPEDTVGRQVSGSFLHNGTVTMFEHHGFVRDRQIGKHRYVVTRRVG